LSDLIANKRERPADDLLTALAGVFRRWRSAVRRRAVGTAYLLILAGYETTVNFIGNGILALLRNPAQLASLRAEPSGLSSAVEEFLRFESPLNIATTRVTTVPVRIGEVEVPADEFVMIALVAANRDLHQFDEPDRLNIARNPNAHLAFGHGIHYCLGAPAGPARRRDRARSATGQVRDHHAGRHRDIARPQQHFDARAAGATGSPRLKRQPRSSTRLAGHHSPVHARHQPHRALDRSRNAAGRDRARWAFGASLR